MVKNIGKNTTKILSGKYSPSMLAVHQFLDLAKQSATDVFKTASKWAIQKTAEPIGDFIGIKVANKIMGFSKNSETVTNQHDKEILKERYIWPEKRLEIIDNLRLK